MINLKQYKKNIYYNYGVKEAPYYSEDGVISKIFKEIKVSKNPTVVEFGEHRVLGTTTRAFRIIYFAKSLYFAGNLNLYSTLLNVMDVIKISFKNKFKYFKFLFNLPFKYIATPENIINLFTKNKITNIDLICVDIDSYDYFIAKKILSSSFQPKLFIIEYNLNLPINESLTLPFPYKKLRIKNKRIYGASFLALYKLFKSFNYKLVHISGFNNLYFIHPKYEHLFEEPNYKIEIPSNDKEVKEYIDQYCQKNFLPSWINEKQLEEKDLVDFIKI